jgi:hypothetical protein
MTTKPENFCIGGTKKTRGRIPAVDFGRARGVLNRDGSHSGEYKLKQQVMPEYSSIWNAGNFAGSRRDDLMSLTLMVIDLVRGSVPYNCYSMETEGKQLPKKD